MLRRASRRCGGQTPGSGALHQRSTSRPDGAVRKDAFDLRLAFQFHTELSKECDGCVQVVDDDGDVVHPLYGHVSESTAGASHKSGVEGPTARRWRRFGAKGSLGLRSGDGP